jgi:DNA polymerase III subunit delta'
VAVDLSIEPRSMSLLAGHENILASLEQAVLQGHPAHAYLFTGRDGIGKKLAAMLFAAMVNCPEFPRDAEASCSVCRRILGRKHPDVIVESPARGMIRIDQVRDIQRFCQYAPIEGQHRVVVMDDAHALNRAAQNALLKTLEEPPSRRILILVTSKPFVLLPTVRSRCRRVRFSPLAPSVLASLLEQQGIAPEKASVLAAMSGGSASRALEMNTSNFLNLREKVLAVLTDSGKIGIRERLELAAEIATDRSTVRDAIDIALSGIRDLLSVRAGNESLEFINIDLLDRIVSEAQHLTSEELLSMYEEFSKASELTEADFNVNKNLVMDVLLLNILRIQNGDPAGPRAAGLQTGARS